ncbi:LOW QUALITY PROTEIN: hypothetical protein CFOL_v3_14159, partial [Cephalotus follicularis]
STFSEYTVVHSGCLTKIGPLAPLDKVCILSGISSLYSLSIFLFSGLGATLNVAKPKKRSSVSVYGLGAVGHSCKCLLRLRFKCEDRVLTPKKNERRKGAGRVRFVSTPGYRIWVRLVVTVAIDGDMVVDSGGREKSIARARGSFTGAGVGSIGPGMSWRGHAFTTHPINILNERTVEGTLFGNYKPRSDLPFVVERYMNKELELNKWITHQVSFSEINEAFEYMLQGDGLRCIIRM